MQTAVSGSMRTDPRYKAHEYPSDGRRRDTLGRDKGFTLVEVLIAAVITVIGVAALFGLLDTAVKATASTRAREGAANLAREILEDARSIPFAQLSPSSITGELQAMNGLANTSAGPGWQVQRRGITYTVAVKECSIDDPKDGWGVHDSTFCKDPGEAEGSEDPAPVDLKRVTVDVTWVARGRLPFRVHDAQLFHALVPLPADPLLPLLPLPVLAVSTAHGPSPLAWPGGTCRRL